MGTKHAEVQEKLLEKGDSLSSLDMALDTARTFEATKDQLARLQAKTDVHAIRTAESEWKCEKCGTHHAKSWAACPAKGQKCNTCGYLGHWAVMCKTKRSTRKPRWVNKSVHAVNEDTEESPRDDPHCLVFETVSVDIHQVTPTQKHEVHAAVNITLDNTRGAAKLRGKIDTGAQGNILPLRLFKQMYPSTISADGFPRPGVLEPSPAILKVYGGTTIEHFGTTSITCETKGKTTAGIFYAKNVDGPAIFGWPLLQALDLVKVSIDANNVDTPITDKESLIQEYPDCFNGIGKLPGKYHITLDPTVPPVVHSPRRVPLALKDDIAAELQEMEQQGIIIKVTEGQPTDWVHSLVYQRKKNGKLRICLDPKDLNKAIKRDYHVTRTVEEILPKHSTFPSSTPSVGTGTSS